MRSDACEVTPSWGTNDATDWARAAAEGSRKVLAEDPAPRRWKNETWGNVGKSLKEKRILYVAHDLQSLVLSSLRMTSCATKPSSTFASS